MCSIGRNTDSAIGAASGSTLGGSLLTGGSTVATGRAGSTLLAPSVSNNGTGAGGASTSASGSIPSSPAKRTTRPYLTQ